MKEISQKLIGILAGVFSIAVFFGCESTTSHLIQPTNGAVFETDAETGYAAVPFEAVFLPFSGGAEVNTDSINVEMGEPGDFFGDKIFDPEDGTNVYGFTMVGPDEAGVYTVSGTMGLLPGSYYLKTSCYPGIFGAYVSDGSDRATFTVISGFDPMNFAGGVHSFYVQSTLGACFWLSKLPLFGFAFDGFLESMIASIMSPSNVDVPGWDDLPATVVVSEAYPPLPEITADLFQQDGEIAITVSPGVIDIQLADPADWMESPITMNGKSYYICGFQFSFDDGFLRPVLPTLTDMEVTFLDMAFYVADSLEGECTVRRAASLFTISSPLDALESCECTAFYKGSNTE